MPSEAGGRPVQDGSAPGVPRGLGTRSRSSTLSSRTSCGCVRPRRALTSRVVPLFARRDLILEAKAEGNGPEPSSSAATGSIILPVATIRSREQRSSSASPPPSLRGRAGRCSRFFWQRSRIPFVIPWHVDHGVTVGTISYSSISCAMLVAHQVKTPSSGLCKPEIDWARNRLNCWRFNRIRFCSSKC